MTTDDPSRAKVLIVDDSSTVRLSLRDELQRQGYDVLDAANGEEGLAVLRSEDVDVLVLDLVMPDMGGADVLAKVKGDPATAEIPVLLLTAVSDRRELASCLDDGADDFIVKPWDWRELRARLRTLVRVRQSVRSARRSERRARALMDSSTHCFVLLDREGTVLAANQHAANLFDTTVADIEGARLWDLEAAPQVASWRSRACGVLEGGGPDEAEEEWGDTLLRTAVQPVAGAEGQIVGTAICAQDVTEQRALEQQLLRAQKLESIGQLAAGIAHEINTPAQYVGDNTRFLDESFREVAPLLQKAGELAGAVTAGGDCGELAAMLRQALDAADADYLATEIPTAIEQSLNGIDRVRKIVQSIKDFSHPGTGEMAELDLNRAIESTITVASNEWRYVAAVETDFDADLPLVTCLAGEVNQAVLNMIVNAAHAIADVVGDDAESKGSIAVSTRKDGDWVEIRIADTGTGIPEEARDHVFDPFFTTKDVGRGTGQGLAIAHGVIVQKHGGTLDFETELGKGTTFIARLPIQPSSESASLRSAP